MDRYKKQSMGRRMIIILLCMVLVMNMSGITVFAEGLGGETEGIGQEEKFIGEEDNCESVKDEDFINEEVEGNVDVTENEVSDEIREPVSEQEEDVLSDILEENFQAEEKEPETADRLSDDEITDDQENVEEDEITIEASGQTISDDTTWENCTVNINGDGTVTFSNRITISGTVTLNLGAGATLIANGGIGVHEGNSLTIDGEGNLTANSNTFSEAAIGGSYGSPNAGTITISGGTINASNNSKGVSAAIGGGYSNYGGNGTIIINGGTITTNIIQGGAASIGGSKGANGGHITIAGGSITANRSGAVTGAGIGGGEKGNAGTIIISGGTVTVPACSSARGAGIGGGEKSDGEGSITINDGNITAVGGAIGGSAGIGGGSNSSAGTITITGGVVNATGGYESAGIGGARGVEGCGGTIAISGGQVTARGSDGAYGIGPSKDGAEGTISMSWTDNTDFIDASYAGTITILKGKRFFYDETEMFAKAEELYKQEKKIIPAVLDNSLLSSGEILMQRNFVTTEGTAVDVSYDVYDYNGDKLTDGTDYTAVIKNSNDQIVTTFDQMGDYTLTVTGMGNYSGSNSYTFSLVEWDMALMQDGSEHYVNLPENGTKTVYLNVGQSIKVYDSEGKDGKLVASDGRLLLHVPTGYALVVSGKTDAMKWNEVQHDTTNFLSAYENENLTDEITSLFGNSNNISFASAGNSMLIRLNAHKIYRYDDQYGLELTISVQESLTHSDITIATIPDQTYSGSEICPAVIVNDGETKLTLGTDYTVEYSDNVSAGTAKITITGAGDYTGSILKTFEILKAEPTMVKAPTAVENLVYNGQAQALVNAGDTDFGTLLYSLDGTDYSTGIPAATNAGTYTVYYKVEDSDNWNAVAAQTIEVTIRGENTEPVFTQHALLLSDEIGVQFYVSFPDDFDATGCYVDFAAADGRSSTMQYADAVPVEGNSNVRYFSFNINALELAENITATLHYGENETVVDQYSAMTYIQAVQADTSADDNLKNLVNALQSYGYYMQQSGWTDDKTSHTAIPVPTSELTTEQVTAAQTAVGGMNKTVTGTGLADTKVSLTLNAKTMINIYVKPQDGVTVQSTGCTTEMIGGETYYKFTTDKIGPKNLGTPYSVTVETSSGTATVSASAMSYVNAAFSSNTLSEEQQKALAAYYYYYYYATQYN